MQLDHAKITMRDKLTLGPIEKYKRYGVFPGKLVLHIILLSITLIEVVLVI
jgi:hypothetical protein